MAKKFILNHHMMSVCLLDANFYEVAPSFKPVHDAARREYTLREAAINSGTSTGCSSCAKKKSQRARTELEKKHGALFSQHVSSVFSSTPEHKFGGVYEYVRTHMVALTGSESGADFDTIVAFIPMRTEGGAIRVVEKEL